MNKNNRIRFLTRCALFAAILAVVSPLVIPIGQVGITLATLVLLFMSLTLKPSEAITATALYLSLGAVGLPVFSHFQGGIAAFVAPSGGFLSGYLPFVILLSLTTKFSRKPLVRILGIVLSHLTLYAIGTVFFAITTSTPLIEALLVTVLPFIIPDALKVILALYLAKMIRLPLS